MDLKYEIDSGSVNINNVGKVYAYDNRKIMNNWYGEYADMINGTDGQLFAPSLDRRDSKKLTLFVGQICRYVAAVCAHNFLQFSSFCSSIELEYAGKGTYQGVPVYYYHPSRAMRDIEREAALGFCESNFLLVLRHIVEMKKVENILLLLFVQIALCALIIVANRQRLLPAILPQTHKLCFEAIRKRRPTSTTRTFKGAAVRPLA